jgi:antagonist of KipI
MSIVIIKPGILDTIQDLGRPGWSWIGVGPGGAMDRLAAMIANALTGNDIHLPVIEIHYPGPQILFEQDALITITGGDFDAGLNDEPIPSWKPVLIRKNTVLQFPTLKGGARAYLAVQGGFRIDPWLNSYSTHLKAGVGGWKGRRLEKGDELFFQQTGSGVSSLFRSENNFQFLPWTPDVLKFYNNPNEILFIPGNEWPDLTLQSKADLTSTGYRIRGLSDRMGYHLEGNLLELTEPKEMVSAAVSFGTIQLLPSGRLVILMADHQTTGGYPRVGHVISAHLPKLAQLNPGETIGFKQVEVETAEELLISQQQELRVMARACEDRLNRFYEVCRS